MEKKTITLLAVLCVVSLSAGFWIGKILERDAWQERVSEVVQGELDWVKSQLETNKFFEASVYHVSGTVIEKGSVFLVIEGQPQIVQNPLPVEEPEKRNIRVNINGETEIFRFALIEETPEKVFLKSADIQTGDYIFVVAKEDVRNKNEITAQKIQISSIEGE